MDIDRIEFITSDKKYPRLERTAEDIADFLYKHRSKITEFSEFMRVSGTWTLDNYKGKLQRIISAIAPNKKKAAADTLRLIELFEQFFSVCTSEEERQKMRGLVPEKLFERVFKNKHHGKTGKFGFGVMIKIDKQEIKYVCSEPYQNANDSDGNRQTVDAAFWDGEIGEYGEVKFNPEAFHTKDINYLRLLANALKEANLNYTIYLISFGQKELIMSKLKRLNLWVEDNHFILIGRDELYNLK